MYGSESISTRPTAVVLAVGVSLLVLATAVSGCKGCGGAELAGYENCAGTLDRMRTVAPEERSQLVADACFDWMEDTACAESIKSFEVASACFERYCPTLQGVVDGIDPLCDEPERAEWPQEALDQMGAYVVAAAAVDALGGDEEALREVTGRLDELFDTLAQLPPEDRLRLFAAFVQENIEASRQAETVAGLYLIAVSGG